MQIELERTIALEMAPEMAARVWRWTTRKGFASVEREPERWVFQRGSHWHALYTFNYRKVPTTLTVEPLSSDRVVVFTLCCGSWLSLMTRSDRVALEAESESLLEWVCVIDPTRLDRLDDVQERWNHARDGHYTAGGDAYAGE
jgi:hypothetical protein